MTKRQLAARVLWISRAYKLIGFFRAVLLTDLQVLTYHRIVDVKDEQTYPFDVELISASTDDFRWQMEYVQRHFNPVSFSQVIRFLDGQETLPRRPIIVTIDDGFDDIYENAFPILKSLGVHATVFISTGYIGQERTFWFDWLAHLILSLPEQVLLIPDLDERLQLARGPESRRDIFYHLVERLKRIPNLRRVGILEELESRHGNSCSKKTSDIMRQSRPLDWHQIKEMAKNGIEFGSHSVTHPILTMLTDDELRYELQASKETLEAKIGSNVDILAYPNGGKRDFDKRVQKAAGAAGYRLGVSSLTGSNALGALQPYVVRRSNVERHTSHSDFACMLALPSMFA